jgi:uncharacterized protein (TIGR02001 family)
MRLLFTSIFAAACAALTGNAAVLSGSASAGWEGRHVFRGEQLGGPVLTPALNLTSGDFYAGVWMALPLADGENRENEADFFAGTSRRIGGVATLDAGFTRYAYGDFAGDFLSRDDALEAYAGMTADILPFAPGLYLYRDFDRNGFTAELTAGRTYELTRNLSLALRAKAGRTDADAAPARTYGEFGTVLRIDCPGGFPLEISLTGTVSDHDSLWNAAERPGKRGALWLGVSTSLSF